MQKAATAVAKSEFEKVIGKWSEIRAIVIIYIKLYTTF